MSVGYLLLTLGLVAFGMLGIFHKVADHPSCRPKVIAIVLLFWGGVMTTIYTIIFNKHGLTFPPNVLRIGALGGTVAAMALFVFQTGLKFGKISTSWLIINLATSIPILLSIFAFGEKVSMAKGFGVLLVFIAIVMLWWDKKIDLEKSGAETGTAETMDKSKWLPLMLLSFVGQGMAASSQKLLVEAGGGDYVWQFYIILYWSGFVMLTVVSRLRGCWPNGRELRTGAVMAVCSMVGNVSITTAMTYTDVKGFIAYPVSNGGSLTLVILAGILFFREKISKIGIAGIACGLSAILVLVYPEEKKLEKKAAVKAVIDHGEGKVSLASQLDTTGKREDEKTRSGVN